MRGECKQQEPGGGLPPRHSEGDACVHQRITFVTLVVSRDKDVNNLQTGRVLRERVPLETPGLQPAMHWALIGFRISYRDTVTNKQH